MAPLGIWHRVTQLNLWSTKELIQQAESYNIITEGKARFELCGEIAEYELIEEKRRQEK